MPYTSTRTSGATEDGAEDQVPNLRVIGTLGSHDTLQRVVGSRTPCRILDVPAGEGVFCDFLRKRGWEVHAADIDPGHFKLRDVPFTRVNLNEPLPYADGAFDAVSCVNGLHRLLFPQVALAEFFRILKPAGRLYVNVNNYSSLWKRMRFLLTGTLDESIETQDCFQTIADPQAHVRLPLMYTRLAALLAASGFDVVAVQPAAVSRHDRVVRPLAYAVAGAARLIAGHNAGSLRLSDGNHPAVLGGGSYIFIEAIRRDAAALAGKRPAR
jgi:SAM-dependent methyltransferase